jgi:inner membrane protein
VTTFEHALLGINGTIATGLHRRFGWQIAALAGVAAAAPDWDGLPILFSRSVFADAHRVWGHNLAACVLLGTAMGLVDYRYDLITRCARRMKRLFPREVSEQAIELRSQFNSAAQWTWIVVAVLAALSHLLADAVVSGAEGLTDWSVRPFWPFARWGWVYPLVPWGDVGITVVFVAGMFAMLRWQSRSRIIAALTLCGVCAYIALRGTVVERLSGAGHLL